MLSSTQPAILVVSPSWVGDIVMAQSLLKVLKREHPAANIDVLAPQWAEGLLKRMLEVRHVITHTIKHGQLALKARYRLGQELRHYHYNQAIILPNSWKSGLIPFWAKIPQRTGYIGEWRHLLLNDARKLDKLLLYRTVDQFAALGLPLKDPKIGKFSPHPQLSPARTEHTLQRLNLAFPQKPLLALCPGAEYGPAKRWPLEYFAQVAKRKIAEGWQVWLFGSEGDTSLGMRIQALAGDECTNLCGQTDLAEVVDLLSLARVIITNDTGLMHIAAALDKPLLALYGSSDPSKTPPLSHQAHILYLRLPCSPCFQRTCPLQHLNCLRDLTPDKVLEKLNNLSSM